VRNFLELLASGRGRPLHTRQLKGVKLASIGPVTSSTLRECGLRVDIEAGQYTIPGLIQAISAACRQLPKRGVTRLS
jgi:uroporphyrinogen III methyltransferase/synthase